MNWLTKISGITFSLEQSHRIAQPKTISTLSYDLADWATSHVPRYLIKRIDMDGLNPDQLTGTINWYIDEPQIGEIPMYVNQWIQEEMSPLGFDIKVRGPERSNSFDSWVWRIDVLKNPTEEYTKLPKINLSNSNARALLGLLNIPFDHMGSVSLRELRQRLALTTEHQVQEFTQSPEKILPTKEEPGPQVVDFGRSKDQINRYIQALSEIVDYGLSNGFTNITWY